MKCSKCGSKNKNNFYTDSYNRKSWLCKKCAKRYVFERQRFLKKKCIEYAGGKCEKCGYDENYAALEFHHKDDNKEFEIGSARSYSWEKIKREIDKCSLLCSRCHREEHFPDYNKESFKFEFDHESMLSKRPRGSLKKKTIKCKNCGKEKTGVKAGQKYCSLKCAQEARKVVDWPTKIELTTMLESYNFSEIGRKYGVSCNAVRNWCKKYEI